MWIDNHGRERFESPFGELILCQNTATNEIVFRRVTRLEKLSTPIGHGKTHYYHDPETGAHGEWTVPSKLSAAEGEGQVIKMRGLSAPVTISSGDFQ